MNPAEFTGLGVEGGLLVVLSLMLREIHSLRASFDAKVSDLVEEVSKVKERLAGLESQVDAARVGDGGSLFSRRRA